MASEIKHKLGNEFEVIGYVKPGASMKGINEGIKQVSTTLTKKDTVVIWGGANDIARNESNKALTNIIKSVKFLNHTKVLLVNIPTRFDLTPISCVNEEITTFNRKLLKWIKIYEHVKLVYSTLQRNDHTRHGMHMKTNGKELSAQKTSTLIKEQVSTAPFNFPQEYLEMPAP